MKKIGLYFLITAFVCSNYVSAQMKPLSLTEAKSENGIIPIDKAIRIGKLDNGLTYMIRQNKQPQNHAEFQLVIKAGSILEEEDQVGLAHFTEHMAFNGTKYFPGNQMIDILEKKGMTFGREINAYTSFDQTVYTLTLTQNTPEYLDLGMKVLDGWASGLLMDGKEIDSERGVILEELRQGLGADDRLRRAIWPTMLNHARYVDRLPIGTEENLKKFKYESIRRFYKDWYRPDLMAVILVGDFDVNEMEKNVKEIFGAIPKAENLKERTYYSIPDNDAPLIVVATDKGATKSDLSLFWKHKKKDIKTWNDFKTVELYNALFNGMIGTRLAEIAEKPNTPFIYASAGYGNYFTENEDVFMVNSRPKDNQSDKTISTLLYELLRIKQHGFLESELERQKEDLLSRYERAANEESKKSSSGFASQYVDYFLKDAPVPGAKTEFKYAKDLLNQISLEQINALINEWITPNNFVLTLTGPLSKEVKFPSEKEILALYNQSFQQKTEPWVDTYTPEPLITDVLLPVPVTNRVENKEVGYTEITLANGVKVVLLPTELKNDQIVMTSYSPGGISVYPDNKVLSATMAASIVDMSGLGDFTNNQLSKKLKGINISCTPVIRELSQGISGSSTVKDMETLMQLTYLFYKYPRKDTESFERFINNKKNQIRFMGSNPQVALIKKLKEISNPEDKRSLYMPTEEELSNVQLDDVYAIYKERFADASQTVFFFVGSFTVDSILPVLQQYLGNLPSLHQKENWVNRSTPFTKGIVEAVVEKGTEKQGLLAIVHKVDYQWDQKENVQLDILSAALQITVREIIREKIGGTYSPDVQIQYEKVPNEQVSLTIIITCNPESAEKLRKETLKILNSYTKKGVDKETLAKVKEQLITEYKKNCKEENTFWLNALYSYYSFGIQLPNAVEYEKMVQAVTPDQMKQASKKYVDMRNYVSVIQKPETTKAEK